MSISPLCLSEPSARPWCGEVGAGGWGTAAAEIEVVGAAGPLAGFSQDMCAPGVTSS